MKVRLTPLMVSAFFGNLKTVETLLRRGANVHAADKVSLKIMQRFDFYDLIFLVKQEDHFKNFKRSYIV